MKISVDPRTELLTIVQYLGQYDRIFNFQLIDRRKEEEEITFSNSNQDEQDRNDIYRDAIEKRFGAFREHKAVMISDELAGMGFAFDAPHFLIHQYSLPPKLEREVELPSALFDRVENRSKLILFIDALRDFSEKSGFMKFFNQQKSYYNHLIGRFSEITEKIDYAEELHLYLNITGAECSLELSPLNIGNYGCHRQIGKKYYPISILGMTPRIIENFLTKERVAALCWHEFAHTYINPLTAQASNLVEESSTLFPRVVEKMRKQAYPEWKIHINETIIRVITNRLSRIRFGETAYQKLMKEDKEKGFIFIDEVNKVMASFEKGEALSPSIKECHKAVLTRLIEMSPETLLEKEDSEVEF